jgi:transcriptional regulator with XRE-family HTH domain
MQTENNLIKYIRTTLIRRDMSEQQFVKEVQISMPYWISLKNGHRSVQGIKKDRIERIAKFLELPVIQVLMLSGFLTKECYSYNYSMEKHVELAIDKLKIDPIWLSNTAPINWPQIDLDTKLLIALLYNRGLPRLQNEA